MIMFTRLPVPADQLDHMWKPEALRSQGMSLVRKDPVRISGLEAQLALVTQVAAGASFEKWILALPAEGQVFLCVAAYRRPQSDAFRSQLRNALLSIAYEPTGAAPATPTFHVDVSGLRLATRLSKTELYTENGEARQASPGSPLLVVGPSAAQVSPVAREEYAERRLRQTAQTNILEITKSGALSVDDLPGYESVATATDKKSGVPMIVYQVMLFADDHYFLIQGVVGQDRAANYLPLFKQAARSFRRIR
jgi:hypothetical protein